MSQRKLSPIWRSRFLTLPVFCKGDVKEEVGQRGASLGRPRCHWPNDSWPSGAHKMASNSAHCHPSTESCHRLLWTIPAMTFFFVLMYFPLPITAFGVVRIVFCSVQLEITQGAVMQPLPRHGEAEKHALQHGERTVMSHWIEVSTRSQAKETVRPGVEAPKKHPTSCCRCEPMETPQSLWRHTCSDCTAKVGTRARTAH